MTLQATTERTNEAWLQDLRGSGPQHDEAVAQLRDYLLRSVLVYLTRQRTDLGRLDFEEIGQLAEDWAQAGVLQVLDKLDTFRGASKFTTWAYRVAINLAAADLRRKQWADVSMDALVEERDGLPPLADDAADDDPESAATREEIWEAVREVIQQDLTERQRTALTMSVVDGAPMEAVARALDTNRNNVYKIVHDARKKLKQAMETRGWSAEDVFAVYDIPRAD